MGKSPAGRLALLSLTGYPRAFTEYRMNLEAPSGSMPLPIKRSRDHGFSSENACGYAVEYGYDIDHGWSRLGPGNSGLLKAVDLQRSWPVVLIALALAQLAMTMRSPRLKGWGLLLLGDWFLVNTMTDWAYLHFAFPLLVAGVDYWIIAGGMNRNRHVV